MKSTKELQTELLCAEIGLARALSTNPPTETSDETLRTGLLATGGNYDAGFLLRQIEKVHEEKNRVSPSCVVCEHPCGANADADPALFGSGDPDGMRIRLLMLGALRDLARNSSADDPDTAVILQRSVFNLGDERRGNALTPVLDEFTDALMKVSCKE